ncbi:MAG: Ig-like domain-containing protein, partial [Nocardioidaceae bacterium]
ATDAAGNLGPAATDSYVLDTTGPPVAITSSPATPDNDLNPSWSFSTEAGADTACELRRSGVVVSDWTPCVSPEGYNLTGLPDGAYTFSVRATDSVGNTGNPTSSGYTLDTTPPEVTITSEPAPFSSEQNPMWEFETEMGAMTECELSGPSGVLSPWVACTGSVVYDLSSEPDGLYTFSVRGTDSVGNPGSPLASSYTLDRSGPSASITSSPSSPGSSRSPAWSFTAEAGATTECQLSGSVGILSLYAACSSPTGYDLTGQADGPYAFSVRATDAAGNVGAPAGNTYTLDTTAPAAPAITSEPVSPGNDITPEWSFTAESGATTQCELRRGGVVVSAWGNCVSPAAYSVGSQPDGDYTFRVRATDAAGNTGAVQAGTYSLDTAAPVVVLG